ncbi:hypothetical protein ABIA32_000945 [Streptacidiphilus sp. MAP12-20]|uniref:hypothetical protein n=1 Tax=Streptacidiphilus sp. MAP12-20 TaxID=3156299 RepID=UPI003514E301
MPSPREKTALDVVAAAIDGPSAWVGPLLLDGTTIHPALPARDLPLSEVRSLMLSSRPPYEVRNAVWAELAFHAQHRGADWELGAVWMMAPGLRKAARRAVSDTGAPYADIEAEVVEGFLRELRSIDIEVPAITAKLWWAGYRQGLRALADYRPTAWRHEVPDPASLRPHASPPGHPDSVLDRAVSAGVISAAEAELIGGTRLETGGLAAAAMQMGLGYQACRRRRTEAEERLARFLLVPGVSADPTPLRTPPVAQPRMTWTADMREAA